VISLVFSGTESWASVSGGENARLNGAALGQSVVRVC